MGISFLIEQSMQVYWHTLYGMLENFSGGEGEACGKEGITVFARGWGVWGLILLIN